MDRLKGKVAIVTGSTSGIGKSGIRCSCVRPGQIVNVDGGLNSHVSTVAQFKQLNSRTW